MKQAESMKEPGSLTSEMVRGTSCLQMETRTTANINLVKPKAKESTYGPTAKFTMENGSKGRSKETVYGKESMETAL